MATEGKTSRLAQMQMRFQQKQQHELQQKRSEMAINRNFSALDINDNKFTASLGAGKVRQMFDERRQRTNTGIDKSYPLQPISSRKSPIPPATNMVKSHSTLSDGKPNADLKFKLHRLPASADGTIHMDMDNVNGNHTISNKQNGFGDSLDNETFPDFFEDDSMLGQKSVPVKLPNVGRPISNFNKSNGNMKLKPVVGKNSMPPTESIAKKPLNTKKLAPVATRPQSTNQQPFVRPVKSVTGITSKPIVSNERSVIGPTSKPIASNERSTPSARSTGTVSASQKSVRPPTTPPENMAACGNCGRFFNEERVEKHESICKKQKKRKVFDATKHRYKGTEVEVYVKKVLKTTPKKQLQVATPTEKKSNWRKKHEEFIAAIRSAKQVKAHLAAGGKLSDLPPPPPSENPDYVQCPHCSRRFNQSAAERHIPKCANFQHNKPKPVPKKKY